MKNLSKSSKLFAFIALTALSVWIGSYLTRLFLVYNLFTGPELQLKDYVNDQNLSGIVQTLLPAILTHFVSYITYVVTFVVFLFISKLSLKQYGWLFIILVAVLVTLPFEAYLMNIDYKIITILLSGSFDNNQVISLLRDRIKDLSSFPIVILFSYISFFYFVIFQPLTKKEINKHEN